MFIVDVWEQPQESLAISTRQLLEYNFCNVTANCLCGCSFLTFKFKSFLLAYINGAKGFHCDTSLHAYNVLCWNSLPLLLFLTSVLVILMDFLILFSYMCTKYFSHIYPHFCGCSWRNLFHLLITVLEHSMLRCSLAPSTFIPWFGWTDCAKLSLPFP
jgi:hypothetical protein